ncbi:rhodanese-related sulfurtransferase [Lactobacillus colini]|uniref:Rhodanese-related sulfurtransferase n=1 Tax=Lactobacillus colini TaxID=1819254 RepID=A0ABS4MFF9_9LACO|nr:rhodanese-like domain-containing protein [Lactobacillus colini]MBP2058419.1 rhodanese-related sulfurtransferase [Lactobacillus colini]
MKEISTTQLQKILIQNPEVKLFDVREPIEYSAGHVPESSNFPLEKVAEFDLPKNEKYYFICRSGNRSGQFCHYLTEQGYQDVTNVVGGMITWDGEVEADF